MADLSSAPKPTPEQFLQEYHFHCDLQPKLYYEGEIVQNYGNYTRLVEGDLIPVTDRKSQQLAKRCADLYDKFLASANADCRAGNSGNISTNNGGENNLNNNNKAQNTSDDNNANPAPQQQEKQTLHIPLPGFLEFTNLYHNLIRTANPVAKKSQTDREADLAQREQALLTRETSLAHREATARMLFSTPLLTQQITSIWAQGYEAGYQPGFELGRRSGSQVAYRGQVDALGAVLRRVREIRGKFMSGVVGGAEVGKELGELEREVEGLVRRTCVAAGKESGLGVDKGTGMVVGGDGDRRQDGVESRELLKTAQVGDSEATGWGKVKGEEMDGEDCRGHGEEGDVEMEDMEGDSGVWV